MTSNPAIKYIDLFAGIGGLSLPADEYSYTRCVFASEHDKFAAQAYDANHPDHSRPVDQRDIRDVPATDIPSHDLLLGGIPCVSFSSAGLRKGFDDERGQLYLEVIRIAKHHKPKAMLLENVPGLVTHDNGRTIDKICGDISDLGYRVFYRILDARYFGLPQRRRRVYFVCIRHGAEKRKKIFEFPWATHNVESNRVRDILEPHDAATTTDDDAADGNGNNQNNNNNNKYIISDRAWESHKARKARNKAAGKGFGYSLFHPEDEYTNTITARYYKDGSEILIDRYPGNPRKLSPREALNLQGFPRNFVIDCSDTQTWKQAGNSVAVPVVRAITAALFEHMGWDRQSRAEPSLTGVELS